MLTLKEVHNVCVSTSLGVMSWYQNQYKFKIFGSLNIFVES